MFGDRGKRLQRLGGVQLEQLLRIRGVYLTLAWETFEQFDDKNWSFTDCTSKVVMEQLGIKIALPSITTSTSSEQFK